MKETRQKKQPTQRERRKLLGLMTLFSALLMCSRVGAVTSKTDCPIELGEGYVPDELTIDDAYRLVDTIIHSNYNYQADDLYSLLWRFHTLPANEAQNWLKHFKASFDQAQKEIEEIKRQSIRTPQQMKEECAAEWRKQVTGRSESYYQTADKLSLAVADYIEHPESAAQVAEIFSYMLDLSMHGDRLYSRRLAGVR